MELSINDRSTRINEHICGSVIKIVHLSFLRHFNIVLTQKDIIL